MKEPKLWILKGILFFGMIVCFSFQSFESFQKWLEGKTSISESYIEKDMEPLPSFSICAEPSFDGDYMKNSLNITPNLFLFSSALSKFSKTHGFPQKLSGELNAANGLYKIFYNTAIWPQRYSIGDDLIVLDQFVSTTRTEIESFEHFHRLNFYCF